MFKFRIKHLVPILLYAVPNTVLSFGIVYIINNALVGKEDFQKDYMFMVFFSMIVFTYLLNIVFQKKLNQVSFNELYKSEKSIFDRILRAPLLSLENLGSQRFFTTVEDIRVFAYLPYTITHTVNSLLMLVLCLIYMFTLSIQAALIVVGLIIVVAACYFIVMHSMSKQVEKLRKHNEEYYEYVDDVMKGFKELKLSFFRRENLMNRFLIPNRDNACSLDFNINYVFLSINLISQYGLYFVVSVILFVLPNWGLLPQEDVIAYVVIILFISGPINNLINLEQTYTRFLVAHRRINRFLSDFENTEISSEQAKPSPLLSCFEKIVFEEVAFNYQRESNESAFSLGPVNVNIKNGETIFIIGGNGSGKSTFINVLTGLYTPEQGSILLDDGESLSQYNIQSLVAAVFTDNHLFAKNYEDYELENNELYKEWLKVMKLDEVVLDDKENSARRKFSKGQSKRMSLIFALLENKPILVLDEWAADQDPHFRKFFYEELLPRLKKEGKTIIAVTHDDAYFHHADRILKFNYGQIVKNVEVEPELDHNDMLWA